MQIIEAEFINGQPTGYLVGTLEVKIHVTFLFLPPFPSITAAATCTLTLQVTLLPCSRDLVVVI